jgi:hypothetical protein
MDAFGIVNVVCEPASTVKATGGWSGSAWLFGPSLIHYSDFRTIPGETGIRSAIDVTT